MVWTDPIKILSAIAEVFASEIFDEYQPEYWGFETQEEWDERAVRFVGLATKVQRQNGFLE
jgi:hypothetical protein